MRNVELRATGAALLLVLLAGCGGGAPEAPPPADDPPTAPPPSGPAPPAEPPPPAEGPQPTIESIQEEVFGPRCSSCHTGASAPQGLRLTDARTSYNHLVNVPSAEVPIFLRVAPGDPEASYLIDKLEGTNLVGERMPPGGTVTPERIAAIREWITRGAPPPGPESAFLPAVELPLP